MPRIATTALLATAAVMTLVATSARIAAEEPAPPVDLPGVDVSGLTAPQLTVLREVLSNEFCHCGCPHTVEGCLKGHKGCHHAPRMAYLAAKYARQSLSADDVRKILSDYYGGFDRKKRVRLDVSKFGPPLGEESAPVAIVEFSDFTCPFCQRIKPELDRFVRDNSDRVRLYYKPFPIASHPRAMEAAIAAEWARDHGLFWKMYEELFSNPRNLSDSDLEGYATAIGGDPDDLRKALESERNKARIIASRTEGLGAKMAGTPTLFLNGRKFDLPYRDGDLRELLDFAVEDEQEWIRNEGWKRD
jgi:protein-disulfide isomerase